MIALSATSIRARKAGRPSPRQRLLAAADELFYTEGVHVVGIDRILEHADVAKASMYSAFASKEALIAAYLQGRHTRNLERIWEAVEQHTDPRLRLLAVFDAQARCLQDSGYRGCAFARASAETPTGGLVQQATDDYRSAVLDLLTRLAADAGAADPATLGLQLHLLYNGAAVLATPEQWLTLSQAIRSAAKTLLDTSLARAPTDHAQGARGPTN